MVAVVLPALAALAAGLVLTPLLSAAARRAEWVDAPGPLKVHARPVPYTGGLAILGACILALVLAPPAASGRGVSALVLGPAVMMSLVGLFDDRRSLPSGLRLAAGVVASLAWCLGALALGIGGAGWEGAWWRAALAVFYLVGSVNAVNMQDGLDGLAAGLVFLSSAGCAAAAAMLGEPALVALALAVCGAVAAFLVFNWPPATVFMGDNGSYFLGFVVGAMTLSIAAKGATVWHLAGAILVVGLPVVDAALAIARRLLQGKSPFSGDRAHLHDRLAQRGLSTRNVDAICWLVQLLLVGGGLLLLAT
jgi:UDP-GlcNAc:undecaprenyl-phosphate GlcNAc-1-phosphate transferase